VAEADRDELWRRLTASWDDRAAHDAFVERCREDGELGVAAARYREVIQRGAAYREASDRMESAQRQIESVLALAAVELETLRAPRPRDLPAFRFLARWGTIFVLLAVLVGGAMLALHR
jgi:hypothetical protein